MNKDTIELERVKSHIKGYSEIHNPWTESRLLDAIVKWSEPILTEWSRPAGNTVFTNSVDSNPNKDKKIYRHILRMEEENISTTEFYLPFEGKYGYKPVPRCERVYYLDIYWQ